MIRRRELNRDVVPFFTRFGRRATIRTMQTKLIKTGDSAAIPISKAMLTQAGLGEEVNVVLEGRSIVITSPRKPREGWAEEARKIAAAGEDRLLIPDVFEDEDLGDWDHDGFSDYGSKESG